MYLQTSTRDITDNEKVQHLQYMINLLLPFMKQICEEQSEEQEIEAKIQGILSFNFGFFYITLKTSLTITSYVRKIMFGA